MRDSGGIGLLISEDSFNPFNNAKQLMPCELCVGSLPPTERYQPENMLLYMLVPPRFKAHAQAKFFNYVVKRELRDLHYTGINNKPVRVAGISMDLRGREKFLSQLSCLSFYGCSVCSHRFDPGLATKVSFTGARRWLPRGHPLRNEQFGVYDFVSEERRTSPNLRTTESVIEACAIVQEEDLRDFMGKGQVFACLTPLLC